MRLDKVTLRHKRKGTLIKVNAYDFANDLGAWKYRDYTLVRESFGDRQETVRNGEEVITITQREAQIANADTSPQHRQAQDEKVKVIEQRKARRGRTSKTATDK